MAKLLLANACLVMRKSMLCAGRLEQCDKWCIVDECGS